MDVICSSTPKCLQAYLTLSFYSSEIKWYSFDNRANGYSRSKGFGVVVLKLLVDAIGDNNTIRAVIRATAVTQDGRTPGITQPSSKAQEAIICQTYGDGGMNIGTTLFIEAHGTATALGAPLEAKAAHNAFKGNRPMTGITLYRLGRIEYRPSRMCKWNCRLDQSNYNPRKGRNNSKRLVRTTESHD